MQIRNSILAQESKNCESSVLFPSRPTLAPPWVPLGLGRLWGPLDAKGISDIESLSRKGISESGSLRGTSLGVFVTAVIEGGCFRPPLNFTVYHAFSVPMICKQLAWSLQRKSRVKEYTGIETLSSLRVTGLP